MILYREIYIYMYLCIGSYSLKGSKNWNEDALKLHIFHSVCLCGKCYAITFLKVNKVFSCHLQYLLFMC